MAGKATKKGKRVGKKGQEGHFKGPNQVSELKGEKFHWDNDDLTETEMADKEPKLVQPDLLLKSQVLRSVGTKLSGRPRTLRRIDPSLVPGPRTQIPVT